MATLAPCSAKWFADLVHLQVQLAPRTRSLTLRLACSKRRALAILQATLAVPLQRPEMCSCLVVWMECQVRLLQLLTVAVWIEEIRRKASRQDPS